jgi:hypothetical protein
MMMKPFGFGRDDKFEGNNKIVTPIYAQRVPDLKEGHSRAVARRVMPQTPSQFLRIE